VSRSSAVLESTSRILAVKSTYHPDQLQKLRLGLDLAELKYSSWFVDLCRWTARVTALSTLYEFLLFDGHLNSNPVLAVRRRYSRRYMAAIINSEMDIRNKAIITLLAKTSIRRNERITLDVFDVDLVDNRITMKPTAKRSNRMLFINDE